MVQISGYVLAVKSSNSGVIIQLSKQVEYVVESKIVPSISVGIFVLKKLKWEKIANEHTGKLSKYVP